MNVCISMNIGMCALKYEYFEEYKSIHIDGGYKLDSSMAFYLYSFVQESSRMHVNSCTQICVWGKLKWVYISVCGWRSVYFNVYTWFYDCGLMSMCLCVNVCESTCWNMGRWLLLNCCAFLIFFFPPFVSHLCYNQFIYSLHNLQFLSV